MTTLESGRLPDSYDAWRTRGPLDSNCPDVLDGTIECEECGHEWDGEFVVLDFDDHGRYGYEARVEGICPECGSVVTGTVADEPDYDSMMDR